MSRKTCIILAVWFWSVVNYLDRVAIGIAGPAIMSSLALPPASFGIILSSFGLGYMLAQVPGGMLADRWGAKVIMVAGPISWALFTGLTGLVSTLVGFVIVRFCFGLSEGLSVTSLYRTIGESFEPQERARAIAITLTALAVAPAVAGPFVGALVLAVGWQGMFFLLMMPALLAALVNSRVIPSLANAPQSSERHHDDEEGSVRAILIRPTFWLMATFYFGFNIAFWGYLGWMPSYLSLARHIELASIGLLAGVPYLFAFLGLLLGGWLGTGRLHRHRPQMIAVAHLCAAVSLFLAYRAEGLGQSLAGLSSTAFFLYGSMGGIGAVMLDLAPVRYQATYVGCVSMAGQIGGLVAPAIVGFLVSATGAFASGFGFMIAALCAASGCMLALARPLARKLERRALKLEASAA